MAYDNFQPDYTNLLSAANNIAAKRLPLYEHSIWDGKMEEITGKKFRHLNTENYSDQLEYFRHFNDFFKQMGYDTVTYECGVCGVMPFGGLLSGHGDSVINSYEDFLKYPWDEIPEIYYKAFSKSYEALRETMPAGMKAVGGVGNGIFECVQEIIGYMNLCYIKNDDPELYAALFAKVGDMMYTIWEKFMRQYGDIFCVLRMGDDLGFKSNTLLSAEDIKTLVIPQYKRVIDLIHSYKKPFLFHSCGCIFDVMPELINEAGINAKHSNEDQIANFDVWVEKYGDKIGNFGGIDTDAVCRLSPIEINEYINDVLHRCSLVGKNAHPSAKEGTRGGGLAFGTGNSVPEYVPADNYIAMVEAVRKYRGE